MTRRRHKSVILLVALIHLFGSVGYAGVAHFCRHHQQHHAVAEGCCCVEELHEALDSCCAPACGLMSAPAESLEHAFHNQGCCEQVSFFHQVEETAPAAPSAPLLPASTAWVLLPPESCDNPEIREHAVPSLAAPHFCLPLLN